MGAQFQSVKHSKNKENISLSLSPPPAFSLISELFTVWLEMIAEGGRYIIVNVERLPDTNLLALKNVCPSFTHPITISAPSIFPWPLEMPNPTHPVVFASTVKKISSLVVLIFQWSLTFWLSSSGEKNECSAARLAKERCWDAKKQIKRKTHRATDDIALAFSQEQKMSRHKPFRY